MTSLATKFFIDCMEEVLAMCGDGKEAFRSAVQQPRSAAELYQAARMLEQKRKKELADERTSA